MVSVCTSQINSQRPERVIQPNCPSLYAGQHHPLRLGGSQPDLQRDLILR